MPRRISPRRSAIGRLRLRSGAAAPASLRRSTSRFFESPESARDTPLRQRTILFGRKTVTELRPVHRTKRSVQLLSLNDQLDRRMK